MAVELREPGTYRSGDGTLIHCRVQPDGTLRIDVEGVAAGVLRDLFVSVKLSDDPDWPDVDARPLELFPRD